MSINWNRYLASYQTLRGGHFFGAAEEDCDSHLVLMEGEPSPILVWVDEDPAGRSHPRNLKARTMVQLNGDYTLSIWARSLVGAGVKSVIGLVKGGDYGYPEATRGRVITTDNKAFTKLVLGDLDLRSALMAREKEYLKVRPAPQGDGWHVVEVGCNNFEGLTRDSSPWLTDVMYQDISFLTEAEKETMLRAGSLHFAAQMDEFLAFLRAARGAVTAWRL